jgi:MFS family permease
MESQAEIEKFAPRIVFLSSFAMFIIFGIRLSFSVFFAEYVGVEGWSNEASAGIFSMSMLVFAFGSTPAGILLDRFGARVVFTGGVILTAVGLLLSSQASSVEVLIVTYGIVGGAGLAVVGLGPIAANISLWFPSSQRGRAIGFAFAGTGLGSLLFVPFSAWLIEVVGWRNAYLVQGGICLLVLAPLLAFGLRSHPQERARSGLKALASNSKDLFRRPAFWLLMLVSLNALGPLRALTVHQIAYIESLGIERQTAAFAVGLAGFLTALSYLLWGYLSDRFGRTWVFLLGAAALMAAVVMLFVLAYQHSILWLIAYALFYALAEGTRSSQTTALASDVFHENGLGFINGLVGAAFGLGAAISPWLVGLLRDQNGDYVLAWWIVIVMNGISILTFLGIRVARRTS